MDDQELLELAAKAAGIKIDKSSHNGGGSNNTGFDMLGNAVLDWHNGTKWNPLTDDGAALRLAVVLGIDIHLEGRADERAVWADEVMLWVDGDALAATRRAVVMAAANRASEQTKEDAKP